jgi:hypothetical protein
MTKVRAFHVTKLSLLSFLLSFLTYNEQNTKQQQYQVFLCVIPPENIPKKAKYSLSIIIFRKPLSKNTSHFRNTIVRFSNDRIKEVKK